MYKLIDICPSATNRNETYLCDNEKGYYQYLKHHKGMCEKIGEYKQYIKPVFDVDAYKTDINIDEVKHIINDIFPDKPIYYCKREPRDTEKGLKYSYRFYVDKVKLYILNMNKLVKHLKSNPIFDTGIYNKSRLLFLPYTTMKIGVNVPELKIIEGDLFKCCASYVEEDFEDWNDKVTDECDECDEKPVIIEKIDTCEEIEEEEEDMEDIEYKKSKTFIAYLKEHIKHFKKARAEDYNDWLEIIMCICNIGDKYEWDDTETLNLCECFSQRAKGFDKKKNKRIILGIMASDRDDKVGYKRFLERLKEDDIDYYVKSVGLTYKEMKPIFEEEYCFVNNPTYIYRTPKKLRLLCEDTGIIDVDQVLKMGDFTNITSNVWCVSCEIEKDGKKVWKKKKFAPLWFDDPYRLTYEGVIFAPSGIHSVAAKSYKNLFQGFYGDNINIDGYDDYSNIQPILDHIKNVLVNGNEEHFQYVMKWLAKIIKEPENRPQVGLIFYSKEHGLGKNLFTNFLIESVFGVELCASCRNVDKVLGRFNSVLSKCMFLVFEEASGELKRLVEDLKNIITEPNFMIERKGIDTFSQKNYVNMFMNTNNEDILDIDSRDRRFCILETCKLKDIEDPDNYFKNLAKCVENKKNGGLFMKYLRNEVDTSWTTKDFQANRPITSAYKKSKSLNTKNPKKFISHIVKDEYVDLGAEISKWKKYRGKVYTFVKEADLYRHYVKVCEQFKYTTYNYDKFINYITEEGSGIIKGKNSNKLKGFIINKSEVEEWVSSYRNCNEDEDLPTFEFEEEEVEDEE